MHGSFEQRRFTAFTHCTLSHCLFKITNNKELERQLSAIATALGHNNNNAEDNWQDQEKALQTLHAMLNGDKTWKDSIVREIRALSSGIVQCVSGMSLFI